MADSNRIANALMGFSAGMQGRGMEFMQQQQQQKMQQQAIQEQHAAALTQDAYSMLKAIESGNVGVAVRLGMNSSQSMKQLGFDSSEIDQTINDLASGDPAKFRAAVEELRSNAEFGMGRGWVQPPESAEIDPYKAEKLKLDREKFEWQKQNPNAGTQGAMGTANQRDWETYQQLLKTNPSEAEAFGRAAGFASREGQQLSSYAEKQIDMASTEAAQANNDSNRYLTLADQIKQSAMSGGIQSTWGEYIKEQTGNQDEVTALRKQVMQIVNSEAVKNLPPGPATDRDIEMVRSPFPTEKAAPEYIANWLGAVARLNQKRAEFSEFKSNFISENGSLRTRSGESMISAWKRQQERQQKQAPKGATPGIAPAAATGNEPSLDDLLSMY